MFTCYKGFDSRIILTFRDLSIYDQIMLKINTYKNIITITFKDLNQDLIYLFLEHHMSYS